jgi:hypothetical protein
MAMPMSACLRAGASLTPVAGHCHHLAARLQGAHQAQLLLGFDTGEYVGFLRGERQRFLVERRQLAPGQRPQRREPDLAGNRQRGDGVVAGDHLDPDAGRVAAADRADRRLARRIDHAGDADQA